MPITLTRGMLAILIPGGVALSTWILLLFIYLDSNYESLYSDFTTPINMALLGLIIILGSFIEGIGSYFEVYWDEKLESEFQVSENWYKYLCNPPTDCVAQKYISRMVTSLYFELGIMLSSLIFGVGLSAVICTVKPNCYQLWSVMTIVFSLLSFFYFKKQARESHMVLCKVRKELNERSCSNIDSGVE